MGRSEITQSGRLPQNPERSEINYREWERTKELVIGGTCRHGN